MADFTTPHPWDAPQPEAAFTPELPRQNLGQYIGDTALDTLRGFVGVGTSAAALAGNRDATDFGNAVSWKLKQYKSDRGQQVEDNPDLNKGGFKDEVVQAATGILPYILPTAAATIAGGVTAGPVGAFAAPTAALTGLTVGDTRAKLRDQIRYAREEEIVKSPVYQQARADGLTDEQARDRVYDVVSNDPTMLATTVAAGIIGGGVTSHIAGRFVSKNIAEAITQRVMQNVTAGATRAETRQAVTQGFQLEAARVMAGKRAQLAAGEITQKEFDAFARDLAHKWSLKRGAVGATEAFAGGFGQMALQEYAEQDVLSQQNLAPAPTVGGAAAHAFMPSLAFGVLGGASHVRRRGGTYQDGQPGRDYTRRDADPIGTEQRSAAEQMQNSETRIDPGLDPRNTEQQPNAEYGPETHPDDRYAPYFDPSQQPRSEYGPETAPGYGSYFDDYSIDKQRPRNTQQQPFAEYGPEVAPRRPPNMHPDDYYGAPVQPDQPAAPGDIGDWGGMSEPPRPAPPGGGGGRGGMPDALPRRRRGWGDMPEQPAAPQDAAPNPMAEYGPMVTPNAPRRGGFARKMVPGDITPEASLERYQLLRNDRSGAGQELLRRQERLEQQAREESGIEQSRTDQHHDELYDYIESQPHLKAEHDAIRRGIAEWEKSEAGVRAARDALVQQRRGGKGSPDGDGGAPRGGGPKGGPKDGSGGGTPTSEGKGKAKVQEVREKRNNVVGLHKPELDRDLAHLTHDEVGEAFAKTQQRWNRLYNRFKKARERGDTAEMGRLNREMERVERVWDRLEIELEERKRAPAAAETRRLEMMSQPKDATGRTGAETMAELGVTPHPAGKGEERVLPPSANQPVRPTLTLPNGTKLKPKPPTERTVTPAHDVSLTDVRLRAEADAYEWGVKNYPDFFTKDRKGISILRSSVNAVRKRGSGKPATVAAVLRERAAAHAAVKKEADRLFTEYRRTELKQRADEYAKKRVTEEHPSYGDPTKTIPHAVGEIIREKLSRYADEEYRRLTSTAARDVKVQTVGPKGLSEKRQARREAAKGLRAKIMEVRAASAGIRAETNTTPRAEQVARRASERLTQILAAEKRGRKLMEEEQKREQFNTAIRALNEIVTKARAAVKQMADKVSGAERHRRKAASEYAQREKIVKAVVMEGNTPQLLSSLYTVPNDRFAQQAILTNFMKTAEQRVKRIRAALDKWAADKSEARERLTIRTGFANRSREWMWHDRAAFYNTFVTKARKALEARAAAEERNNRREVNIADSQLAKLVNDFYEAEVMLHEGRAGEWHQEQYAEANRRKEAFESDLLTKMKGIDPSVVDYLKGQFDQARLPTAEELGITDPDAKRAYNEDIGSRREDYEDLMRSIGVHGEDEVQARSTFSVTETEAETRAIEEAISGGHAWRIPAWRHLSDALSLQSPAALRAARKIIEELVPSDAARAEAGLPPMDPQVRYDTVRALIERVHELQVEADIEQRRQQNDPERVKDDIPVNVDPKQKLPPEPDQAERERLDPEAKARREEDERIANLYGQQAYDRVLEEETGQSGEQREATRLKMAEERRDEILRKGYTFDGKPRHELSNKEGKKDPSYITPAEFQRIEEMADAEYRRVLEADTTPKERAEIARQKARREWFTMSAEDRALLKRYEEGFVTSLNDGLSLTQRVEFQRGLEQRIAELAERKRENPKTFLQDFMQDRGAMLSERAQQLFEALDHVKPNLAKLDRKALGRVWDEMQRSLGEPVRFNEHVTVEKVQDLYNRTKAELERIEGELRQSWELQERLGLAPEYGIRGLLDPSADLTSKGTVPRGAYVTTASRYFSKTSGMFSIRDILTSTWKGRKIDTARAPLMRHFMDVVSKVAGKVEIVHVTDEQMINLATERRLPPETPAFYDPITDRIFVTHEAMQRTDRGATLVHEMGHVLTETAIQKYPDIAARFEEIRRAVKAVFNNEKHPAHEEVRGLLEDYPDALSNVHEFVSHFWAKDYVMLSLSAIDSTKTQGERWNTAGRSGQLDRMLKTIKNAILKAFGKGSEKKLLNEATVNALEFLNRLERDRERSKPYLTVGMEARTMASFLREDDGSMPRFTPLSERPMSAGEKAVWDRSPVVDIDTVLRNYTPEERASRPVHDSFAIDEQGNIHDVGEHYFHARDILRERHNDPRFEDIDQGNLYLLDQDPSTGRPWVHISKFEDTKFGTVSLGIERSSHQRLTPAMVRTLNRLNGEVRKTNRGGERVLLELSPRNEFGPQGQARPHPAFGRGSGPTRPANMRTTVTRLSEAALDRLSSVTEGLAKFGFLRNLNEHMRRVDPRLAEKGDKIADILGRTQTEQMKIKQNLDDPVMRTLLEALHKGDPRMRAERLTDYINTERYAKVFGSSELHRDENSWQDASNPAHKQGIYQHGRLREMWNALTPEEQAVVKTVRSAMAQRHEDILNSALTSLIKASKWLENNRPAAVDAVRKLIRGETLTDAETRALDGDRATSHSRTEFDEWVAELKSHPAFRKIEGPYYPLMREGDFLVSGRYDLAGIIRDYNRANPTNRIEGREGDRQNRWEFNSNEERDRFIKFVSTHPDFQFSVTSAGKNFAVVDTAHFSAHEVNRDAQRELADLQNDPVAGRYFIPRVVTRMRDIATDHGPTNQGVNAVDRVITGLRNSSYARALDPAERNILIRTMEEIGYRAVLSSAARAKTAMRKYTRGASDDIVSSVHDYLHKTSYVLAEQRMQAERMKAFADFNDEVRSREWMKDPVTGNPRDDMHQYGTKRSEYHRELVRRAALRPKERNATTLDRTVSVLLRLTQLAKLGSPSYHGMNFMEPGMLAQPHLAGEFGTANALRELAAAYGLFGGNFYRNMKQDVARIWREGIGGDPELVDHTKSMTDRIRDKNPTDAAELIELVNFLDDTAYLHRDAGMDLAKHYDPTQNWAGNLLDWFDNFQRAIGNSVEGQNRGTTAIAAYRLARQAGQTKEEAQRFAQRTLEKTAGLYTWFNKPEIMNSDSAMLRMATQFRNYSIRAIQNYMLMTLGAYHHLRGKETNPEIAERNRILARQLARLTAVQGLAAGAFGQMFWAPVAGALDLTSLISGYNSDDLEHDIRAALADVIGKDGAMFVTRGGLRLLGADFGGGLGERLSSSSPLTYGTLGEKPENWYAAMGHIIGGASLDTAFKAVTGSQKLFDGIGDYMNGRYTVGGEKVVQGMAEMVPIKLISDSLKVGGRLMYGDHTPGGAALPEPDALEVASNMLGFRTGTQVDRQDAKTYFNREKKEYDREALALKRAFAMEEDPQARADIINRQRKEFNANLPEAMQISREDMWKYAQQYAKQRALPPSQLGLPVTRRSRPIMESLDKVYRLE